MATKGRVKRSWFVSFSSFPHEAVREETDIEAENVSCFCLRCLKDKWRHNPKYLRLILRGKKCKSESEIAVFVLIASMTEVLRVA